MSITTTAALIASYEQLSRNVLAMRSTYEVFERRLARARRSGDQAELLAAERAYASVCRQIDEMVAKMDAIAVEACS